jgi:hypothetical protein
MARLGGGDWSRSNLRVTRGWALRTRRRTSFQLQQASSPFATAISQLPAWDFALARGYDSSAPEQDLAISKLDNSRSMPKCVFVNAPLRATKHTGEVQNTTSPSAQHSTLRVRLPREIFTSSNAYLGIIRSATKTCFRCLLSSDGAVLPGSTAFTEAVTHHALGKQKKDNCQDDYKQKTSYSEPGWLSPCRGCRIRIGRHQSGLSNQIGRANQQRMIQDGILRHWGNVPLSNKVHISIVVTA